MTCCNVFSCGPKKLLPGPEDRRDLADCPVGPGSPVVWQGCVVGVAGADNPGSIACLPPPNGQVKGGPRGSAVGVLEVCGGRDGGVEDAG